MKDNLDHLCDEYKEWYGYSIPAPICYYCGTPMTIQNEFLVYLCYNRKCTESKE